MTDDYTACGHRMIVKRADEGGTVRVAVYCDLPVSHRENHHADVQWDEFGRAAQGIAVEHLRGLAAPPIPSDPAAEES